MLPSKAGNYKSPYFSWIMIVGTIHQGVNPFKFKTFFKSRLVTYVFDKRTRHLNRGHLPQCMQHCIPCIKGTLGHDRANGCKFTSIINLIIYLFIYFPFLPFLSFFSLRRHDNHMENLVLYELASTRLP